MLSYIGSYLGYTTTNSSSSTTTVTVELGPQQPVSVQVPNNSLSVRIVNWFAEFVKLMQAKTIGQTITINMKIYLQTLEMGHIFSKVFFARYIHMDPDLKVNKEKWEICFKKIEGCVEKTFEEIYKCSQGILVGCLHENGMPLSVINSREHEDLIYFGDQEEIKQSGNYFVHLLSKVDACKVQNCMTMLTMYSEMCKELPVEVCKALPCQVPLNQYVGKELFYFLDDKIEDIWKRVSEQYRLEHS